MSDTTLTESMGAIYEGSRSSFRGMQHFFGSIDDIRNRTPIACSLHRMLPDHVRHFQMAFDERDMMLKNLEPVGSIWFLFMSKPNCSPQAMEYVERVSVQMLSTALMLLSGLRL